MSDRQDEALQLASALIDDVELSQTSTARRVLKAQRLARLTQNTSALEWIGFELAGGSNSEAGRAWMTRTGRWTNRKEGKGYWRSAADLEATRDSFSLTLQGISAPISLSGDFLIPAMNDHRKSISAHSENLNTLNKVLAKIDQEVYKLAIETYNELRFSQVQGTLFDTVRLAIDSELAGETGQALRLVDGISERLASGEEVALSQAMTTCRQLIDTIADHAFPPSSQPYTLANGVSIDVKNDKVKNRLNAYVDQCGIRGGRAKRIGQTLNEIYSRVSTSVHNSDAVNTHEAHYLFLGTYMLLGEIITLPKELPRKTKDSTEDTPA